jgi:hypothetical protein
VQHGVEDIGEQVQRCRYSRGVEAQRCRGIEVECRGAHRGAGIEVLRWCAEEMQKVQRWYTWCRRDAEAMFGG